MSYTICSNKFLNMFIFIKQLFLINKNFLKVFNTAGPRNENKCLTEETKSREVIFFFSRTHFGPTRLTTATSECILQNTKYIILCMHPL